jgi:Tfp pilus assembly protein FimT
VLTLIVLLGALTWPALDTAFSGTRLRKAADQVRAGFSGARVEAMQSGEVQLFRYAIDGAEYRIEGRCQSQTTLADPLFDEDIEREVAAEQSVAAKKKQGKLPEGITFVGGETTLDSRAAMISAESSTALTAEPGWSQPILFYPDGTTSDARLTLANQHGSCIDVTLRGLTGVVKVSDVYAGQER